MLVISNKFFATNVTILCLIVSISCAEYNAPCVTDNQCHSIYTDLYHCQAGHCIREPFTWNNWREIAGAIVIVIISMFANAGGLGAGAVIIPVYIFIYGFAPTDSIPLSKITIFAGAIATMLFGWNERLPSDKNKFLIQYEMASTMIPLQLVGTMIGVLLSKLLPPVVVCALLVFYLILSTSKMWEKAKSTTKKENAERQANNQKATATKQLNSNIQSDLDTKSQGSEAELNSDNEEAFYNQTDKKSANHISELIELPVEGLLTQKRNLTTLQMLKEQVDNYGILFCSFTLVLSVALQRGGHGFESIAGINSCSGMSWGLLFGSQFVGFGIAFQAYKKNAKIFHEEDQGLREKINQRKKILAWSYLTGIAAGTLGIGGGMILGPFMLALGMDPAISTALCGFTVLFTSSSTTTQFMIAGAIHIEHAWVLMIFSLIGSFMGNMILKRLIKKYNRPSLVIWVIFGILALACLVLPAQTIYNAISKESAFAWGQAC